MLKPQAVIFDMDGTLVDTERVNQTAWCRAAAEAGVEIPESTLCAFVGCSIPVARTMINELFGDETLTDWLFDRRMELFVELRQAEVELQPGALEAVRALAEAGLPVALATTTTREHALPLLERFGVARYLSASVCGDEVERDKPAPDIYLAAARLLGVAPEDCLAVEDSMNGALAALDAGMMTVLVPDRAELQDEVVARCARVLESLHELPTLVLGGASERDEADSPAGSEGQGETDPSEKMPRPATTALHAAVPRRAPEKPFDPFIRAENEDDDGYDPYSDRLPDPDPLFERNPWA